MSCIDRDATNRVSDNINVGRYCGGVVFEIARFR
jgi:hypothetical protein